MVTDDGRAQTREALHFLVAIVGKQIEMDTVLSVLRFVDLNEEQTWCSDGRQDYSHGLALVAVKFPFERGGPPSGNRSWGYVAADRDVHHGKTHGDHPPAPREPRQTRKLHGSSRAPTCRDRQGGT